MTWDVVDAGLGAELLFVAVGVVLGEESGELDHLEAVGGYILVEVAHIDGAHGAAFATGGEATEAEAVDAEHALDDGAALGGDGVFGGVGSEGGFRREVWVAPVEEEALVGGAGGG